MKNFRKTFLILLILSLMVPFLHADKEPVDQVEINKVMKEVYPALVRISVVTAFVAQGREHKSLVSGSGAIISSDGYVVTNHHVVGGAKRIWCTLSNREEVEADLIGTDALCDIAVIKLKPETMRIPVRSFPYATWADSDKLEIGQKVFAMGSPGAISQTVTYGIIGNLNMVIPDAYGGSSSFMLDGEPVGSIVRWIIHDATIFGGNSGGPLVNLNGEIIGINEIGIAGLGGAIPSNTARNVAESLMRLGYVERSWIGVTVQTLLQTDESIKGILVSDVVKGSPGELAGIKSGDVILKYNDLYISGRYQEQLPVFNAMIFNTAMNTEVPIVVVRDGKEIELKLTTVPRGKAVEVDMEIAVWGITARNMTKLNSLQLKRDKKSGVFVSSVQPGGPVGQAKPAIQFSDIITHINNKPVNNLDEMLAITKELVKVTEKKNVLVTFERTGEQYLTAVKLGEDESNTWARPRKAWFPAKVQVLTSQLAEVLDIADKKGVRITKLFTPLQDGPFKLGDIITHIDDMSIEASSPSHSEVFPTMIRKLKANKNADFTIIRDGAETKITYKVPKSPKPSDEMSTYINKYFEFTVQDLSIMDKIDMDLPEDYSGVLVKESQMGGWMSLAKIAMSDILLSINGEKVENVEDVEKIMTKLEVEKANSVIFYVYQRGHHFYAEARPKW